MNRIFDRARAATLLTAALVIGGTLCHSPVRAIDAPVLMRESDGLSVAPGQLGCPLEPSLTGDCGNLRYYNLCSGYIWIFASPSTAGEGVGVRFDDACIRPGNYVDRLITYFRNVQPGYGLTVDVYLDNDLSNDGCPDNVLFADPDLDPALRWNCSDTQGLCIADDVQALIIRTMHDGGSAPMFATDGARSELCDPQGTPHSYYYGLNGACVPWPGPTSRDDNFLYWLIISSGCTTASRPTTWGSVKGLYR